MHTIRGVAERDPAVQEAREVVERQVKYLAHLLDDLLDVSRLTQGKIELRKKTVALQRIVAEAIEAMRSLIDGRAHLVSVSLPDDPLWLEADSTRLSQVAGNLLENAVKYTPPGGEIRVTGYRERDEVVLSVRDNGVGIAPGMLPRVFDLFVQAEQSLARPKGGLGIGLTLARRLIELHGGRIIGQSDGPGRGSEFVVRLPVGVPVGPGERDDGSRVEVRTRHILIVEDDDNVRKALHRILQLDGHRVEVARDGPEGVELALATGPDVAFIDLGLPRVDGFEVGRRIRATLGEGVLLVALTGYGLEQDRRRSSAAGFDAHLVKPVSYDDLIRLLRTSAPSPSA
jgi:CheY-like chemotaxis protein